MLKGLERAEMCVQIYHEYYAWGEEIVFKVEGRGSCYAWSPEFDTFHSMPEKGKTIISYQLLKQTHEFNLSDFETVIATREVLSHLNSRSKLLATSR